MKKTILSLLAIATISMGASAQITINIEGETGDYAGSNFSISAPDDSEESNKILVYNNSGAPGDWIVSRRRINVPATWTDFLCWGHETDQLGGVCIDAQSMDMELYTLPGTSAVTVNDGEHAFISSYITPSFNDPGTATYRYYVGTDQNPFMDSVDFVVTLTPLSIPETKPNLSVAVQPNPATEYMVVTAQGVESATVRVVDVLGNEIVNTTITGSKSFNVSEYRNGIYFVIVESKGVRVNRKVFVRH